MNWLSIITPIAVLTYLILQSVSDIKTKQVYVAPNNVFLIWQIGAFVWDVLHYKYEHIISTVFVLLIIFILHICNYYGSGDAKALAIVFLSLRYLSLSYPLTDVALFLLAIFVANVGMIAMQIVKYKSFRILSKKQRVAYFPYLTFGYFVSGILGFFNIT